MTTGIETLLDKRYTGIPHSDGLGNAIFTQNEVMFGKETVGMGLEPAPEPAY